MRGLIVLIVLAAILFLSACASTLTSEIESPVPFPIEKNYTSFPAILQVAEDDNKQHFFSSAMKVTYKIKSSGDLEISSTQHDFQSEFKFDTLCPERPYEISELDAFKLQSEFYLLPGDIKFASDAYILVGELKLPIVGLPNCAALSVQGAMSLAPYPNRNNQIAIHGMRGKSTLKLKFPEGFMPFEFIRYESGAIIPAPLIPDTFMFDLAKMELRVVYRATFSTDTKIRKVDYRAIPAYVNEKGSENEKLSDQRRRNQALRRYLSKCSAPDSPRDPCISENAVVDPAIYR